VLGQCESGAYSEPRRRAQSGHQVHGELRDVREGGVVADEATDAKQDRIAAEAKRREIEQYAKANDEHMRVAEERLGAELASLKKALSDAKKSAGMRDED
jgi:hypothetical protein